MNFRTFKPTTANYVVHHVITVWQYQQSPFTAFMKRRGDGKKGKKPWGQKGSGRARHGSRYSPLFGRSATNKAPHGLDNKRKKKNDRLRHCGAISTVLQSKWKGISIIHGLEDWAEPRQKKLEECIQKWSEVEPGERSMLMITRNGYGQVDKRRCVLTPESFDSPLYLSGRHIPRFEMRRPRDIDPVSDGLFQCLKGRRLFISREAFFDLDAKYNKEHGWAFKRERDIQVEVMQDLVKEIATDRAHEIEIARTLPRSQDGREFWAKEEREKMELAEAA